MKALLSPLPHFASSLFFAACDAAIHLVSTSPDFPDLWIS